MLYVHRSHRTEALLERLAVLLDDPLPDLVQQDRVMVASAGMVRWVQTRLAQRNGVVAGVELLYPGKFIDWLVSDLVAPDEEVLADPWEREPLTWSIAGLLLEVAQQGGVFGPVHDYFVGEDGELPDTIDRRVLGFAGQVARLFDRYALYRPGMLKAWAEGVDADAGDPPGELSEGQRWQAALWRTVRDRQQVAGPAERVRLAVAALREGATPSDAIPPRLSVFGMSSLPPLHLELVAAVADHRKVHLLVPSPSPVLWNRGRAGDGGRASTPLLRAASDVARDAGALLDEVLDGGTDEVLEDLLGAPEHARRWPGGVLGALQRSVVADAELAHVELENPPGDPDRDDPDRSVVFHDCHGPLRQVEALRDEVQRRLDDDPSLEPRHIAVLTPDIETFGPLVGAVFESRALARATGGHGSGTQPPPIPVSVADRAAGTGNGIAVALQRCLALATNRASAAEVLDLLRTEPVARHLGITADSMRTIERWVRDTGVRWARDEDDRADQGQPPRREHTWAAAIDRLLIGVTMADEDARTFADVVPYDHVEDAGQLDLLERLLDALAVVDGLRRWREPRSPQDWRTACARALDALTGPVEGTPSMSRRERDDHRRERERVDAVVRRLGRYDQAALALVDVRAVARWVEEELTETAGAAGQGTGAVTVADLVPMRAVPYRVVCLLGMDDGAFPRATTRPAHDLLGSDERAGDPDRRAEDRHLFVEALLAARDGVVVVYGGRDQRTGRRRPPALPVAELRDAVQELVGEQGLADRTVEHAVLPVSPREFTGLQVTSYDQDRLEAARALLGDQGSSAPFAPSPIEIETDRDDTVEDLDRLVRTLQDPARALVDALRLRRLDSVRVFPATEPLDLGNLERAITGRELLDAISDGGELDDELRTMLARGAAPAGVLGRLALAPLAEDVAALHRLAAAVGTPQQHELEVTLGDVGVRGTVSLVLGDGEATVLDIRFVRPRADRTLGMWVRHLAVTASLPDHRVTTMLGHRAYSGGGIGATVAPPVDLADARRWLDHWIGTARRARTCRVDLLPELSMGWTTCRRTAIATALEAGHDEESLAAATFRDLKDLGERRVDAVLEKWRQQARKRWDEQQFSGRPPLREEAENRVVYRDVENAEELVLGEDFQREARALDPLVDAVEAGKDEAKQRVAAAEAGT